MQEVIFAKNGKLVLQKRKKSHMDESFRIVSIEIDNKNEKKELERLERLEEQGGFNRLVKDYRFVVESVFETMNTYFEEEILNITNDFKDEQYNQFFRRNTNIQEQSTKTLTFEEIEKTVSRRPNHNMLTLHTKNRPDGAKLGLIASSDSSNSQKKYALLAQASYLEGDKDKIDELLIQNNILYGFKLDTSLSSQKESVFVNPNSGEVVISYKGTNPVNMENLWDDFNIILGTETHTSRFNNAEQLYKDVESKYGKDKLRITGHSLGASVAMYIGEKHDVETHAYNPGISYRSAFQSHKNNTNKSYVYTTSTDPVSILRYANTDAHRTFVNVRQKDVIDPHSIDNFIKKHDTKTIQDVGDFTLTNKLFNKSHEATQ